MPAAAQHTYNAILNSLPLHAMRLLEPHLEAIELPVRMQLERPHQTIKHAYFPTSGFASVVVNGIGAQIEVGIVGREGITAMAVILGAMQSPHETYIQSPGKGYRILSGRLREMMGECSELRDSLLLYTHVYQVQMAQTCLSNGRGRLEERLARWLLMSHDRTNGDQLSVTHEFLSVMLGVRRPGVTVTINALVTKGMIIQKRGMVEILDRRALEDASNGSYGLPEAEFKRLFSR